MERQDLPALRALGFEDDELKKLGLWEPATSEPADLAEAYIRRSKAKDTVSALRGHLRDICRKAREEGKQIRHVWFEQKSASKAHVRREEFESAVSAVKQGLSKTLYVWRTDRLSRRGIGAVVLIIDEFNVKHARIVVTSEGLDSSQPGMKIVFSILADRAEEEAKSIAVRTAMGTAAHKADGRWPGGVTPYGLESPKGSGKLRRNAEYPNSRRIADLLLAARTPASVAEELNSEGITTRHGKKWRAQTIIHMSMSVSWAGLVPNRERVQDEDGNATDKYRRASEPLMDAKGHPVECGQGVVTYDELLKIRALISGRSRAASGSSIGDKRRGVRQPVTILTDLFKCPHCAGIMGNGGRNYNCRTRAMQGPSVCPGAATQRERAEDAVTQLWTRHILNLSPESETIQKIARRWLSYQDPAKEARKRKVSAALESAVGREVKLNKEFFVLGRMTENMFDNMRVQVAEQITALKVELAELSQEADLSPLMDAEALTAIWDSEGIEGRRALLQAAIKSVTITPAKYKGDRTPIHDRLKVEWRDAKDPAALAAMDSAMGFIERTRQRRKAEG